MGKYFGRKYSKLLQIRVLTTVTGLPDINMETTWFQHDDCPGHNSNSMCLKNMFPPLIVSESGNIKWSPRPPDLGTCIFFV